MKNVFKLSSLLFVGLVLFQLSCSKDDPAPEVVPDVTGKWALTSATLIEPDPLVIEEFTTDGVNFMTLEVPAGANGTQTTTMLVGGALAATTCQNPANYPTFYIELIADGGVLMFNCSGESLVGQAGTWSVTKDADGNYTVLTLSVKLEGITQAVPIILEGMSVTATSLSGRAVGYPMKKNFLLPISEPGNLQTMTTDMTFTVVP